jgi:S1-C subfamily serine protease
VKNLFKEYILMAKLRPLFLSLLILLLLTGYTYAGAVEDRLQSYAVTVRAPDGSGSGCVFVKNGKAYILTAGHVAAGAEDGKTDLIIERTLFFKGREVGTIKAKARVIAYSPVETEGGLDLALLECNDAVFAKAGAAFLFNHDLVEAGLDVVHVGSLYGQLTNSICYGKVVRPDFHMLNTSFTVVNLCGKPGSSGGPVFTKVGDKYLYIGMLTRGNDGCICFLKPSWVIEAWLKDQGLEEIIH